jgi:glutamate 5-kinase
MTTKLAAARIATASGITVHLADGRDQQMLETMLAGGRGGTVFHPHPQPLGHRKSWLAHALQPQGSLQIDGGACKALCDKGASLLLVGITDLAGEFQANQPVLILDQDGREVARGLSSLSSETLRSLVKEPAGTERQGSSPVVVHRDVLVLSTPTIRQPDP